MRKWGFLAALALVSIWGLLVLVSLFGSVPGMLPAAIGYMPPAVNAFPLLAMALWVLIRFVRKKGKAWELAWGVGGCLAAGWMGAVVWGHEEPGERHVRVMTHNVSNSNRSVPEILAVIQREKPDVVLLQEIQGEGNDPASYLQEHLPGWNMTRKGETAILSHWPLSNVQSRPSRALFGRHLLSAEVGAPQPFTAMTIHWMVPQWRKGQSALKTTMDAQRMDFEDTQAFLADLKGPVILGGDFNNPPTHEFTRSLSTELVNAFDKCGSGPGWTFPRRIAMVRIDHIYSRGDLSPIKCWVGDAAGSDHRSVFADFSW